MAETCPDCGQLALIKNDDENAAGKVCTECGYLEVERYQSLCHTNEDFYQTSNNINYDLFKNVRSRHSERVESEGLVKGRQFIKRLGKIFVYSEQMLKSAISFYEDLYFTDRFNNVLISKKYTLSAVCVFIVARQFDYAVTLKDFCKLIREENISEFLCYYRDSLNILKINLPHVTMDAILRHHALASNLDSSVSALASKILRTCQQQCPVSVASRDGMASVCLYFAWLSTLPHSKLKCQTFKKFCLDHKVQYKRYWTGYITRVEQILTDVGMKLPWAPSEAPKFFAVKYLQDILQYQNSLLYQSFLLSSSDEECDDTPTVNYLKKECVCKKSERTSEESPKTNINCTKRPYEEFQETQVKKRKKHPCNSCNGYCFGDSADSEEELEKAVQEVDDHIYKYIRTADEVEQVKDAIN